MAVEIIAANAAIPHRRKMSVKSPNDGDQVHAVLHGVRIGCRFPSGG
jgi:hypothetical protein